MTITRELEKAIAAANDRQIFCPNNTFRWDGKEGKLDDARIDHISFIPGASSHGYEVEIYLKW